MKEVAKRLDYLIRAIHIEKLPLIKAAYEKKVKQDWEQFKKEVVEKATQPSSNGNPIRRIRKVFLSILSLLV